MKKLSLDRPLVFVHIPKTAGTSFANYLIGQLDPDQVAPPFLGKLDAVGTSDPAKRLFWGHFNYAAAVRHFPKAHYLTFLRDPVARSHSQYRSWHNPANFQPDDPWRRSMTQEHIADIELAQTITFEEFILARNKRFDSQIHDIQTRMLSSNAIKTDAGLESAKVNLGAFDFVGLVEDFDASIARLRALFPGLSDYDVPREKENRGTIAIDTELSQAARDRLFELIGMDMALYDHARSKLT